MQTPKNRVLDRGCTERIREGTRISWYRAPKRRSTGGFPRRNQEHKEVTGIIQWVLEKAYRRKGCNGRMIHQLVYVEGTGFIWWYHWTLISTVCRMYCLLPTASFSLAAIDTHLAGHLEGARAQWSCRRAKAHLIDLATKVLKENICD